MSASTRLLASFTLFILAIWRANIGLALGIPLRFTPKQLPLSKSHLCFELLDLMAQLFFSRLCLTVHRTPITHLAAQNIEVNAMITRWTGGGRYTPIQ
jgi:hypothetical protein